MAQITITIPDDKISRIRDAFAAEYGWSADTAVSKGEFFRTQLLLFMKRTVKNNEGNYQAGQDRSLVDAEVDSINIT